MKKNAVIIIFAVILSAVLTMEAYAGDIDSPAAPTDSGSAMYTLDDIYNRLNSGTAGTKRSSVFTEPGSVPASTGYTLDQVMGAAPSVDGTNGAVASDVLNGKTFWGLTSGAWGQQTGTVSVTAPDPAPVEKTGQTVSYRTGDDGDLQKGVAWPSPRFTDNGNGTVTDNLTGLIWLTNADCAGATVDWNTAVNYADALYDGCTSCFGTAGDCGLSDGSTAGQWRLPSVEELYSLIDFGQYSPALSSGYPFTGVQSYYYWSGSTYASNTSYAWTVGLSNGYVYYSVKTFTNYAWPVRGGQ
ncbi:MAG: DUF1566 domain-containing protein [Desulfobacterales bacterium]|nr:DUF1566 domain-containing protein [Desulfobacterales bacterium]